MTQSWRSLLWRSLGTPKLY